MDEALRASLAELVTYITSLLQTGVGFVQEQAPVVIQQLLMYKIITNWAGIALIIALVITFTVVAKKVCKYVYYGDGDGDALGVLWVIGVPLIIGLFIAGCTIGNTLIQLHFAPAIYLLEYLPKLF